MDSFGTVLSVVSATGEDRSLWVLAALDVYFCNPPDPFDPAKITCPRCRAEWELIAARDVEATPSAVPAVQTPAPAPAPPPARKRQVFTALQLERFKLVLASTRRGAWYRAASHGERVTLASLHTNGFLTRRARRGNDGDADAAYEYWISDVALAALAKKTSEGRT